MGSGKGLDDAVRTLLAHHCLFSFVSFNSFVPSTLQQSCMSAPAGTWVHVAATIVVALLVLLLRFSGPILGHVCVTFFVNRPLVLFLPSAWVGTVHVRGSAANLCPSKQHFQQCLHWPGQQLVSCHTEEMCVLSLDFSWRRTWPFFPFLLSQCCGQVCDCAFRMSGHRDATKPARRSGGLSSQRRRPMAGFRPGPLVVAVVVEVVETTNQPWTSKCAPPCWAWWRQKWAVIARSIGHGETHWFLNFISFQ